MSHTPTDRPASSPTADPSLNSPGAEPIADPTLVGRNKFLGAMFLMATAAIGPGFITQTVAFTSWMNRNWQLAFPFPRD